MTQSTTRAGLDRLHAAMLARVERNEMPGMVTLIAHGDDVYVDPIGVKAFDSPDPMRRDTVFRIASMTKPILAAATMMLVEDGQTGTRRASRQVAARAGEPARAAAHRRFA